MPLTKTEHLDPAKGPKRILSLDGGGIRGILTLQFLKPIEAEVQKRLGKEALLCDYFDLIGGTSTGAILAAGLACGMTVAELEDLYMTIGAEVFKAEGFAGRLPEILQGKLAPKFPSGPLQSKLDEVLGADTTLDSDRIRTGLMVMLKRLDTGSPWPLHNGGNGIYAKEDGALLLTQVVRASTAAPTYFAPERITIQSRDGDSADGAFVDGGVTPFNDPAWQLLMLAALQGHGFRWKTGYQHLLIVSVGTGQYRDLQSAEAIMAGPAAGQGLTALQSLMGDCERMNRATLQWMTNCLTPSIIDRAVGDMKLDSETGPQLATYVRYNVLLEPGWLKRELGRDLSAESVKGLGKMDNPANMIALAELGQAAAAKFVEPVHLPSAFDIDAPAP